MERVVTVNLNGNPYQLETPAYDALRAYLDRAEAALADNPDKAEIVRDLEQAIADKCGAYLSSSKAVISAAEMARILEEMGPVEAQTGEEKPREGGAASAARKQLYRIKEGAVISGVCSGIGAYFDLDPNLVRLAFIVMALFTSGVFVIVYIVLMFLIPSAQTSEEWAAAHGVPFNAQEVIDRAGREYARFADDASRGWQAQMRAQRRAWREQMRAWRHSWRRWDYGAGPAAPPARPAGYVTRVFAGLFAFVFSVITAALLIAFLIALFSFLDTGAILGWAPTADIPGWLVIVTLCIAYAALSAPFSALRRASYATVSGQRAYAGGMDGLFTVILVALAAWFAWTFIPDARAVMESGFLSIRSFAEHFEWN